MRNVRLSYAELSERLGRLANGSVALGLGARAHVAVLSTNCHRYFEAYLASAVSGIVLVPLNHRLTPRELAEIPADSESVALLIHPRFLPILEAIRRQLPGLRQIVVLADEAPGGAVAYEALRNEATGSMPPLVRGPEDLLYLFYTSGPPADPRESCSASEASPSRLKPPTKGAFHCC